jgi:hypothetical protein
LKAPLDVSSKVSYVHPVADAADLPESLRRLIEAWRLVGASQEEIIERLDELELLAHEDRVRLVRLVESTS